MFVWVHCTTPPILSVKFWDTLYTDVSVNNESVACAFYSLQGTQSFKLTSSLSVFIAEKFAIYNALQYMKSALVKRTVICSDSLSAIESFSNLYST